MLPNHAKVTERINRAFTEFSMLTTPNLQIQSVPVARKERRVLKLNCAGAFESSRAAASVIARVDRGRLLGRVRKRIAVGDAAVAEAFACASSRMVIERVWK